ncbi:antitermination protein NusB [Shewanella livingstonensis]|uniref:Antitermination protein NusB n=1 Tax=Shewanella livingstonensis TaxID=150120 RepID=A0A3G8LSN6_9GAMM|nr:antitermination protein NusB [Shewanella livingstonensis]AZG72793.1 antitermination protein NusB [Shewanella livingstonensis]
MNGSEIVAQGSQYALGLGTLALLDAGLAQSKNRSGLLWFFISLPLGPIATFLLVFLDKAPEIE